MKTNNYPVTGENEKCQCVTFDENGNILGSCETLFPAGRMSKQILKKQFPFLESILGYLKDMSREAEPLFFPQVDFECNGYHSICDFTFMKSEDARGIQRFIWMIYDNSIHFNHLISKSNSGSRRNVLLFKPH